MRIVRLFLPLLVLGAVIYLVYNFVFFPLFFHTVKVVHVIDADTLIVKDDKKLLQVQLIGVDAPERTGPLHDRQCFDDASRHFAVENFLAKNQEVRLVKDDLLSDKDAGGRFLRYVYLKNGDFLNEKLLADGLAKQYYDPQKKYQKQDQFAAAQKDAQQKNLGIWDPQGCNGKF